MTLDDQSSIYVGGLPYDATEESIRRVFEFYGAVVEVKIINDRGVGGKCYGFVTFTNPRSADDAINGMDGRTIGGRMVRVNRVRTRGGRSHFMHPGFRHNGEREIEWERGRGDRERYYEYERESYGGERNRDHSREDDPERNRVYDLERNRVYDRPRDHHYHLELDRDRDGDMDESQGTAAVAPEKRTRDMDFDPDHDMHWNPDHDLDRTASDPDDAADTSHPIDRPRRKHSSDNHSREFSSGTSGGDYHSQVKEQLDLSYQRLEELQKEIPLMEDKLEAKRSVVLDLHKKSQRLENVLADVKKLSSQRRIQLGKLHRCFMQVREYGERLKTSEHEFESLVDTIMSSHDNTDDAGVIDAPFANGAAKVPL